MAEGRQTAVILIGLGLLLSHTEAAEPGAFGLGRPVSAAELSAWDSAIAPDGHNLPPGRGSVAQGRAVYAARCAACHGSRGEGGLGDRLVGGQGSLATATPVRTVGSFWPYATTLFDYVRRAMPFDAPRTLSDEDVYAVSAYVLFLNGLLEENAELDADHLLAIRMPNRDGFVADPRPDVRILDCMHDCSRQR